MNYAQPFGCIALLAMLGGCGSEPEPAAAIPTPAAVAQPAPASAALANVDDSTEKMARAVGSGKPGAAVDIKYEFASRPEPGKPVQLDIALIPSAGVDALNATFSGMNGITLAGNLTASVTGVKPREPYKHTLSVLADQAGVYYITVSVDTVISGATLGRTFAIPFVAGTPPVQQKPAAPATTDGTGQPVEPMKAQETTR